LPPPDNPVDAPANQQHWEARTNERTRGAANVTALIVIILTLTVLVLSQCWNAQRQQQRHWKSKPLHDSSILSMIPQQEYGLSGSLGARRPCPSHRGACAPGH
jgi:hypothetical protein